MARLIHAALVAALVAAPLSVAAEQRTQTAPQPKAERAEKGAKGEKGKMKLGKMLGGMHELNRMEIESAQMALEKSQSPQIQEAARMIVQDHQRLDRQLTQVAQQEGVELQAPADPTWQALQKAHEQQAQSWQRLEGEQFDMAFTATQPFMHRFGLAMIEDGRRHARGNQQVTNLLDQAERSMQRHLREAERMMQQGVDVAQERPTQQGG